MKKFVILIMLFVGITAKAQTVLNESGVYELKVVELYDSVKAATLYEQSLVALSDVVGSRDKSKTNIDVAEKDAGMIVYKGELYLGFKKVNTMCGYETFANFTLKVRCKDGKVQYTLTVPSLTMYWSCNVNNNETIPLYEIIPEFTHKGRLYYLKKGAVQFAETLDEDMKALQRAIVEKTKVAADDDF
ncbi:MAG: DUF4468 domain-containing protein [Prevotella sp.]|nr:DUF4468 domain-containing protein [Prevotella sp.]